MKKIFTFIATTMMAVCMMAEDPAETIALQAAQESSPGICVFVWTADSTKSAYYMVTLARFKAPSTVYPPIASIVGRPFAYAVDGYDGYFRASTKMLLQYGGYPAMKDDVSIPAETKNQYLAGWAYVDESDYTLQGGSYYVTVTGYASDMKTVSDKRKGAVITLNGKSQAIENIFESKKPVKFMDASGQVRILRDGKVYNMSGALVE